VSNLTLEDFEREALPTLTNYASIPCLSPMFDAEWEKTAHINTAASLFVGWSRTRAFHSATTQMHQIPGRTPVITVTVEATAPTSSTVVLYGHLDKQPPLGDWSEGLSPYAPVRRGDRLYARGVADDGYAIFSALLALESLEAQGIPHARCVVLIEASEESGSPDLDAYLDLLKDQLGPVELLICLDSGALTYDRLWVTTSLRGVLNAELTVQVLERGQHSGIASGVVPSSFRILRELLDRVDDAKTGEILLEELQPIIPDEHVIAAKSVASEFGDVSANELPTVAGLKLMGTDAADRILRRTWFPTLSVVGMGGIPEPSIAGNVLRASTTAVLSLRLPPNVDSRRASAALQKVLTSNVPSNARVTYSDHAADGWVAPPLAPWLEKALHVASLEAFGNDVAFTGEGGSIPFLGSLAKRYPGVQFVATGVLGPEANAHGIDEMLDLPTAVNVTNAVATIVAAHANNQKDAS
jgi:acetylornithine deacetylase/succinyl-diaminopimelate desuccinylase-like protein